MLFQQLVIYISTVGWVSLNDVRLSCTKLLLSLFFRAPSTNCPLFCEGIQQTVLRHHIVSFAPDIGCSKAASKHFVSERRIFTTYFYYHELNIPFERFCQQTHEDACVRREKCKRTEHNLNSKALQFSVFSP